MTKHVPLLPLSNLRFWRQPLITFGWFVLSMIPALLGAPLLLLLYRHGIISAEHTWLGAGLIMGFMLCLALATVRKIHRQNKVVREDYFRQIQQS